MACENTYEFTNHPQQTPLVLDDINSPTQVLHQDLSIHKTMKPNTRASYFQREVSHQTSNQDFESYQTSTPIDCFEFDKHDKHKIIGYNQNQKSCSKNIIIPSHVIFIGQAAFMRKNLSSVYLPSSVKHIAHLAFADNHLNSLILPENLASIGASAFADNHLTHITIPESTRWIEHHAFYNNNLESVKILSSNITIFDKAFRDNAWFARICIKKLSTKTKIDEGAFDYFAKKIYNCLD